MFRDGREAAGAAGNYQAPGIVDIAWEMFQNQALPCRKEALRPHL
jgi:hypothetical protein